MINHLFFARWPDGSFSIVSALDEAEAYILLDEIADEPAGRIWEMKSCLLAFSLTAEGKFRLVEMGEETADEILKRGYPILRKALPRKLSAKDMIVESSEPPDELEIESAKKVQKATESEWGRLSSKSAKRTPAKTDAGKAIQKKMSCAGPFADAVARLAPGLKLMSSEKGFGTRIGLAAKIANDFLEKTKGRKKVPTKSPGIRPRFK
jgi:hypothetical protein